MLHKVAIIQCSICIHPISNATEDPETHFLFVPLSLTRALLLALELVIDQIRLLHRRSQQFGQGRAELLDGRHDLFRLDGHKLGSGPELAFELLDLYVSTVSIGPDDGTTGR